MPVLKRKLSAIMFSDMAGYTSLMQVNERNAKELLERYRKIHDGSVKTYRGKILRSYGDGALCIFESAVEAVDCAVDIQKELQFEPKVPLRIGIHMGDIVYDEEGFYGESINIASRIQSLSIPGAVLLSDKVYDEIKSQSHLPAQSAGIFELKNIERPVEVFIVSVPGLVVPKREEMKGKIKEDVHRIAVLPFVNMSGDAENEYFSDGITEELINALAHVNGLQVISRTSAFSFKGKNEDIRDIGSKLDVSAVLEGSVRKAGDKIRISAQLVSTSDGCHLWSEVYDHELKDIFQTQDDISHQITAKFKEQFSGIDTGKRQIISETASVEAYNLYLKGKYCWQKHTPESMKQAIRILEEAVSLEPKFAKAYALMSKCNLVLGATGMVQTSAAYSASKMHAERAIALDEGMYESHLAYAYTKLIIDWDWEGARKHYQKAIDLNPGASDVYTGYFCYLMAVGRFAEVVEYAEKALQLDPLSLHVMSDAATAYWIAGRFQDCIEQCNRVLELEPKFSEAFSVKASGLLEMGRFQEAIDVLEESRQISGNEFSAIGRLGYAYAKAGMEAEANGCLEELNRKQETDKEVSLILQFAIIYTALNDFDKAFQYLEKAISQHRGSVIALKAMTELRALHSDPRFKGLLQKIGLE